MKKYGTEFKLKVVQSFLAGRFIALLLTDVVYGAITRHPIRRNGLSDL